MKTKEEKDRNYKVHSLLGIGKGIKRRRIYGWMIAAKEKAGAIIISVELVFEIT